MIIEVDLQCVVLHSNGDRRLKLKKDQMIKAV